MKWLLILVPLLLLTSCIPPEVFTGNGEIKEVSPVTVIDKDTSYKFRCRNVTKEYIEPVTVYKNHTYKENGSISEVYDGYMNVTRKKYVEECDPVIKVKEKTVNYEDKGYKCSYHEDAGGDYVICDHVIAGNGDGVCHSGEVCCKINLDSGVEVCGKGSDVKEVVSKQTFYKKVVG